MHAQESKKYLKLKNHVVVSPHAMHQLFMLISDHISLVSHLKILTSCIST